MQRLRESVTTLWRDKLVRPAQQLTQSEVVVAIAAGVIGGIFPLPLVTTVMTLLFAKSLQLSFPQFAVATSVNMLCTPLQLLCIPLFAKTAALLFRESTAPYTAAALKYALNQGLSTLMHSCARMLAYATVTWTLLLIPLWIGCRLLQNSARRRREADYVTLPGREHVVKAQVALP